MERNGRLAVSLGIHRHNAYWQIDIPPCLPPLPRACLRCCPVSWVDLGPLHFWQLTGQFHTLPWLLLPETGSYAAPSDAAGLALRGRHDHAWMIVADSSATERETNSNDPRATIVFDGVAYA